MFRSRTVVRQYETTTVIGYDEDDFYDDITVGVGAATALQHMAESDIQLLV